MRRICVKAVSILSVAAVSVWTCAAFAQDTQQQTTTTTDAQGNSATQTTTTTSTPVAPPPTVVQPVVQPAPTVVEQPVVPVQATTTTSAPVYAPPQTQEEEQVGGKVPNFYLIGTGAALVAIPWGVSAIVSAESTHPGDNQLWIPLVGPWLDLGSRGPMPGGSGNNAEIANRVFIALDGVFQAVGTLEIISGFLFPSAHYEKKVVKSAKNGAFHPEVWVTPMQMDKETYGMGAVGRF
jgi:hypothetical protein